MFETSAKTGAGMDEWLRLLPGGWTPSAIYHLSTDIQRDFSDSYRPA